MSFGAKDHPSDCFLDGKPTGWNGRPARCRRVRVIVGDSGRFPQYWARFEGLVGEEITAIEVQVEGYEPIYILDQDGEGTSKVTRGGSSLIGHRSLDIDRIIEETP